MGWDGYLKNEIVRAIRKELERSNEMADEVWLTEKQLIEEMPFFKKKWIKKNCRRRIDMGYLQIQIERRGTGICRL